jgi:hypothetical protein
MKLLSISRRTLPSIKHPPSCCWAGPGFVPVRVEFLSLSVGAAPRETLPGRGLGCFIRAWSLHLILSGAPLAQRFTGGFVDESFFG